MEIELLIRRIHRDVENNGKPPAKLGLTEGQYYSLIADVPFSVSKELTPEMGCKFMGIPIEIVEVK